MLTLFFAPGASSMAPHIALHEIGVPFEGRPVSFASNDNKTAEFLAINPEGKVPTLLIEDRPLTEVAGILYYLARRFPSVGLMPQHELEAQAHVVSWMSYIASTVHPARRQGLEHARQVYALTDKRMEGRDWVVGTYSIADIHLFRLFWRFRNSLNPPDEEFPNLMRHYQRMMARPAVKKTIEIESAIGYGLPA
jgi:glutathione S-transferase